MKNSYISRRSQIVVTSEESKQRRRRRTIDGGGNVTNTNSLEPIDEQIFPTSQRTIDKDKIPNDFFESKMINGYYVEFYNNQTNASTHTFTLDKLRHFSKYSISVQACRDFNDPTFNVNTFCSNAVMVNRRTEKIGSFNRLSFRLNSHTHSTLPFHSTVNADDVPFVEPKETVNANDSRKMVKLYWQEPKDPNGPILTYTIIYKRVDLETVRATEQCIPRSQYLQENGEIPLLPLANGNYSVSVMATSLAGDGHPTPVKFVILEVSVLELNEDKWKKLTPLAFFRKYGFQKPSLKFYSQLKC